jgi:hypothetical protein
MLVEGSRNGTEMVTPGEPLLKGLKRMQLQLHDCHSVINESAEKLPRSRRSRMNIMPGTQW